MSEECINTYANERDISLPWWHEHKGVIMRATIILCVLILCAISIKAQEQSAIDSLNTIKNELILQKNAINDSIEAIKIMISEIKMDAIIPRDGEAFCETVTKTTAQVREEPTPMSEAHSTIPKKKTVKVYDFQKAYWLISYNTIQGYTNELYLEITPEMEDYVVAKTAKNERMRKVRIMQEDIEREERIEREQQERREKAKKQKTDEDARFATKKQRLIDNYGQYTANRILTHQIWIGMTEEMAKESIGSPNDINRSTGSWGVHEQWVYSNKYLYFENGKLTSWQD